MKGIYCLILQNRACDLEVGRLGTVAFREGWHLYVGSALGPGGLPARVGRHARCAAARDRPPRWHIDRLLLSPAFRLCGAVCGQTEERLECRLARTIGGDAVPGFGCTDCTCGSHLFYRTKEPFEEVEAAFRKIGIIALTRKTNKGESNLNV
ncbi:GIY-YIG nuclease family protein [Methanofollis fontis]|uniref:DUF123 domain-containing protein n=1 Tax=Methanofollis fontis TaxID=2052832 RepID=A0A483CT57_9EURY|nr:DUF123 domain-containing protein [Methanofollis fontis]TAJ45534.1 DUF123 domain-containing protein [Methanofollis fontis]